MPMFWPGRVHAFNRPFVSLFSAAAIAVATGGWQREASADEAVTPEPEAASEHRWSASLRLENDVFANRDRFYSNGVSVSMIRRGESWLDPFADRLPWGHGRRTVGYELGQIMVTPEDITRAIPDPDDRPYSGILYLALSLHIDRQNAYHGLKLISGVVGSWSLAEETQTAVHRLVGSSLPQGWDAQLHNEPVLNLVYEHRRKYRLSRQAHRWAVEALPVAGFMLGNVLTEAHAGGQVRLGFNVPDDFGTTLMRGMVHLPPPRGNPEQQSKSSLGLFVYGGVAGNLVARNITLDGNTFEDSARVDKKPFVPAAEVGMAMGSRRFLASFAFVFWGREFRRQRGRSGFGALTLNYFF